MPFTTVALWKERYGIKMSEQDVQDYREITRIRVVEYAEAAFETLRNQLQLMGDREYLEAHGGDLGSVAQSHRIITEQLAKFLAAIYG